MTDRLTAGVTVLAHRADAPIIRGSGQGRQKSFGQPALASARRLIAVPGVRTACFGHGDPAVGRFSDRLRHLHG